MHFYCLPTVCLCVLVVICCMLAEVHSYYVVANYDPESIYNANRMEHSRLLADEADDTAQRYRFPLMSRPHKHAKRSVANTKNLPPHEHVCEMKIRQNYQPQFGHEQNGTRVEIQQDSRREFRATFVECEDTSRSSCHGIDGLFSSECVTVYGLQPAGIRLEGSDGDFMEGLIKVPVACQCRLRRKIGLVMADE